MLSLELREALETLEAQRHEARRKAIQYTIVILSLTAAVGTWLFISYGAIAGTITCLTGIMTCFVAKFLLDGPVVKAFKERIIPSLLHEIEPSLSFASDDYLDEDEFCETQLFASPDRYSGQDLVQGMVGQTEIRFSLVHAENSYTTTVSGPNGQTRTETRYRTLFCGLLFIADFNKDISSRTRVHPAGLDILSRLTGTHVALEDPGFHELFSVTSDDQVEARYILTPVMMERLKALHEKFGSLWAAFANGKIYLAIDFPYDAFEPCMSTAVSDREQIETIQANLKKVVEIVNDLDLNKRIWGKA